MCGIVAIVGKDAVATRLFEGLKRLEYRGYDSAGICTLVDGDFERRRAEQARHWFLADVRAGLLARLEQPEVRDRLRRAGDAVARGESDPNAAAADVLDWLRTSDACPGADPAVRDGAGAARNRGEKA